MTALLFDIEATGLLRCGSQLHCIVARDLEKPKDTIVFDCKKDRPIEKGVEMLKRADVLIGHNIIGYDIPLLKERYDFETDAQILDTLVLSRLFYSKIADKDYDKRPPGLPPKLYGSHSLKAWGYRLKVYKGDYAEKEGAWDKYSMELLNYCIQDTLVTMHLYQLMTRRMGE